jgi:hypothetical protein
MDQLRRPRNDTLAASPSAGERYRQKLVRYPERSGECIAARLLRAVLRVLRRRRTSRAAG